MVNVLNATEMYTLQWWLLCSMKFTFSNKKRRFHWLLVVQCQRWCPHWPAVKEVFADEDNYRRSSKDSLVSLPARHKHCPTWVHPWVLGDKGLDVPWPWIYNMWPLLTYWSAHLHLQTVKAMEEYLRSVHRWQNRAPVWDAGWGWLLWPLVKKKVKERVISLLLLLESKWILANWKVQGLENKTVTWKTCLKWLNYWVPGWLSWLSVQLRLRSWCHSSWVWDSHQALCWQLGAWSLLPILCLLPSLPLLCSLCLSVSLSLSLSLSQN